MTISLALGWLSPPRRTRPLVGLALALAACTSPEPGAEGPDGPPGAVGPQGDPGPQGDDGIVSLATSTPIGRGEAVCPYGGIRYDVGLDDGSGGGIAADGVLQAGEIDHTDYICAPAGSVPDLSGFTFEGAAGRKGIDASGGDAGPAGNGGYGGEIFARAQGTDGHVVGYTSGLLDDAFQIPSSDEAYVGPDPLIVATGQSRTVSIVPLGGEISLAEGTVFTYRNDTSTDESLYFRRSGTNHQVTGIRIESGGTLVLPLDTIRARSLAVVPYDIVNAGVITTPLGATGRADLYLGAGHYFGEPSGRIDLTGAPGTASVAGTAAGDLLVLTARNAASWFPNYSSGAWDVESCSINALGHGGVYNRGTIDASAGAWGAFDATNSRVGGSIHLCSEDEVYNEGLLVSRGAGRAGAGGYVRLAGTQGVYDRGAFDIRGGARPDGTGHGGEIQVYGDRVVFAGAVNGWGESIPATTNCTTAPSGCEAGRGARVYLTGGSSDVVLTADLLLHGGDAIGAGGLVGYGGEGGIVQAQTREVDEPQTGSFRDAGDVWIGADIDIRGGAGNAQGGAGGRVRGEIDYGGEGPQGQGVTFVGYEQFLSDGGDGGLYGGRGGFLAFYGGEWGGNGPRATSAPSAEGVYGGEGAEPVLAGGSAVNYVPYEARGGTGTFGGEGGPGGYYLLQARMPTPWPNAMAISRAPVDVSGGTGGNGGRGGFAIADGAGYVEIGTDVVARGGAGASSPLSEAGFGGEGGMAGLRSQYDVATLVADLYVEGGAGFYGGYGGEANVFGPRVDAAGDVHVDGAAGSTDAGGSGGWGGRIQLWSSDTFTVLTGGLTAAGAAGATAGVEGEITVDGFIWQSPE